MNFCIESCVFICPEKHCQTFRLLQMARFGDWWHWVWVSEVNFGKFATKTPFFYYRHSHSPSHAHHKVSNLFFTSNGDGNGGGSDVRINYSIVVSFMFFFIRFCLLRRGDGASSCPLCTCVLPFCCFETIGIVRLAFAFHSIWRKPNTWQWHQSRAQE